MVPDVREPGQSMSGGSFPVAAHEGGKRDQLRAGVARDCGEGLGDGGAQQGALWGTKDQGAAGSESSPRRGGSGHSFGAIALDVDDGGINPGVLHVRIV